MLRSSEGHDSAIFQFANGFLEFEVGFAGGNFALLELLGEKSRKA